MEETEYTQKCAKAAKALILNSLMNNYAVERVAFGYEKPGDLAPIDMYLEQVRLGFDYEPYMRKDIHGLYIDERGYINAELSYSEYVHELFVMHMEHIFKDAPKDWDLAGNYEDLPIQQPFRDYLFSIEPLFAEVLSVEVEYNTFDLIPPDKAVRRKEYRYCRKFVTAILLEQLTAGSQVNKHVKRITCAPYFINRLIEKRGDDYYLKPVDINSYEYIFALFSLMSFGNEENDSLLELKMWEWEWQRNA